MTEAKLAAFADQAAKPIEALRILREAISEKKVEVAAKLLQRLDEEDEGFGR
jgi:hypothetical protein